MRYIIILLALIVSAQGFSQIDTTRYKWDFQQLSIQGEPVISSVAIGDTADVLRGEMINQYGEMFITPSNIDTLTFFSGSTDTLQLSSANQGLIDGFSYASGTLTYDGTDTIVAHINYNLAFSFTESDDILGAVYVNNVKIEKSEFQSTIKTANDFTNASGTILYELAPSDEIRFYLEVEAHNGDDDLIVREFDLNVIEVK
jgi:hypothetical protein